MSKLGAKLATGRLLHWTDLEAMAEWERLHVELAKAESRVGDDREVGSPRRDLAKQISDLEAQMDASGVAFDLSALPVKRWTELKDDHADSDEMSDAEFFEFINAVMKEDGVVLAVTRDGEQVDFNPANDWDDEVKLMTAGQWSRFAEKLRELNQRRVGAPKSQLASLVMRDSDKS